MLRSSTHLLGRWRASAPQKWVMTPRCFSSVAPKKGSAEPEKAEDRKAQPFATATLTPGEWDEKRTDPFFRPPPPKERRIISAEDFANRPAVGFDGGFSSYEDAMITLSWLDHQTSKAIYEAYVQMMVLSQENHGTTSHEYATRVIAQRFNITTTRAAGVIQLQHAEEQMRQHNPELLCESQARYAEETILQNIRDAYKSERHDLTSRQDGKIPYVEDPVGIHGRGEPDETSTQWMEADDMYDMEQKLEQADKRDAERAKLLIESHVYQTDVDENTEFVRTDATCRKLIRSKEQHKKLESEISSGKVGIPYPEVNTKGEKRARWKYVAQVVNTRQLKKNHSRHRVYTNNNANNTIVEEGGVLRVATLAEAKQAAWKPTRTQSNEYLYEGAKKAWLEKSLHGKSNVWGAAPPTKAVDATKEPAKKVEAKAEKAEPEVDAKAEESKEEVAETKEAPAEKKES
eukprot:Nitzschia sp. Nitz4//scaffold32_size149145//27887//29266//NITZ4_002868-RA/size149145-processed-gene-0.118-mRNA-1//-1//CDS//3329548036//1359//frame0